MRKLALVIGNAAYSHIGRLQNPIRDAVAVAAKLNSLGFEIIGGRAFRDLEAQEIREAFDQFTRGVGPGSIALLYYSGHGVQVNGTNYLIPISISTIRMTHLDVDMVSVGWALNRLESAGSRLNIIILDACRSNAFQGKDVPIGLAEMAAPPNTYLSYATRPGEKALDGEGEMSPFATALVDTFGVVGLTSFEVFNRVGREVEKKTEGLQLPWLSSSPINTDFVFHEPQPKAVSPILYPAAAGKPWWLEESSENEDRRHVLVRSGEDLQGAIDKAQDGMILRLGPGEHSGPLIIGKSIELVASDNHQVIISSPNQEAVVTVKSGQAKITGLRIKCPSSAAIRVLESEVSIEKCLFAGDEDVACCGIEVSGPAAVAKLTDTAFMRLKNAITVTKLANLVLKNSLISGNFEPYKPFQELRWSGIKATEGARVEISDNTRFEKLTFGVIGESGAQIMIEDSSFDQCESGGDIDHEGTKLSVSLSSSNKVRCAYRVRKGANAELHECNISHIGRAIIANGKVLVRNCKRITSEDTAGVSIHVRGGHAVLENSRVFGGICGALVEDQGILEVKDCEVFDLSEVGIDLVNGELELIRCEVHDSDYGVRCEARATVRESKIHKNRKIGVYTIGRKSRLEIIESDIFHNIVTGVNSELNERVDVVDCRIFQNGGTGVRAAMTSIAILHSQVCQNNGPGIAVSGGKAEISDCNLRGNLVTGMVNSDGANVSFSGNQEKWVVEGPHDPFAKDKDTSHFSRVSEASIFMEFSTAIDVLDTTVKDMFPEWNQTSEISKNGQQIQYEFRRTVQQRALLERNKKLGIFIKKKSEGVLREIVPFDLRVRISLSQADKLRGVSRIRLVVNEEEFVDRFGHVHWLNGNLYRVAQSHLYPDGWGKFVLDAFAQSGVPDSTSGWRGN